MKNINITNFWTFVISLVSIVLTFSIQYYGRSSVVLGCSYLDPIYIDLLAFTVGLFLIGDGFYRIYEHKNDRYLRQFTRSIRVAIGFGLLTLHIMQFIYK